MPQKEGPSTRSVHLAEHVDSATRAILPPIVANQGMAGDHVPIIATLLDRNGAIPGAQFFSIMGVIVGIVEKPGGAELVALWDDGAHDDGGHRRRNVQRGGAQGVAAGRVRRRMARVRPSQPF